MLAAQWGCNDQKIKLMNRWNREKTFQCVGWKFGPRVESAVNLCWHWAELVVAKVLLYRFREKCGKQAFGVNCFPGLNISLLVWNGFYRSSNVVCVINCSNTEQDGVSAYRPFSLQTFWLVRAGKAQVNGCSTFRWASSRTLVLSMLTHWHGLLGHLKPLYGCFLLFWLIKPLLRLKVGWRFDANLRSQIPSI